MHKYTDVLILCGGRGTRMGQTDIPKALVPIGDKPILWHIMKIYVYYGFNNFVLCLGYKGHLIKEYFKNMQEFKIRFVDTGEETGTGGRIKKAEKFIETDNFFATYGDGLANINLNRLLHFHLKHKKKATITVVRPQSPFGIVGVDAHSNIVTHFEEKPILDHWINGGFFVFKFDTLKYIKEKDVLEKDSFTRLLSIKEICAFKHLGFWKCMDTYKDNLRLNELWLAKKAPWKLW